MKPILKWAGRKTQILDKLVANMPAEYDRYFEPFVGSGALLFATSPKIAVINDINPQLINLYQQIKSNPNLVVSFVAELDSMPCSNQHYYKIRNQYNQKISNNILDAECAALLIYLNKHCFNGLYRVNKQGLFNVPYNNKINGKSINIDNVYAISEYFSTADIQIQCCDFETACKNVQANDFVYFDSPYMPAVNTDIFTSYNEKNFSMSDHMRLAKLFKHLDSLGAKLLMSNSNTYAIHDLYKNYNITVLHTRQMINRDAKNRLSTEVLIKNY